jgi:hypothetical protein
MDVMLESTQSTNDESLVILNCIESVMKNDVVSELRSQTKILSDIQNSIAKNYALSSSGGNGTDPKRFRELLGGMADSLDKIIKAVSKLDDKAADKIDGFLTKLGKSFSDLTKNVDEKQAKAVGNLLSTLGLSILKFGMYMAAYSIISPIAMIGAVMFGLTLRLLFMSIGIISPKSILAMALVTELGAGVLKFGLALTAFAIISPIAMIGAVMFGLTVRLLLLSAGAVGFRTSAALQSLLGLGGAVLRFGLAMVLYAIIAPIAMIGAVLFGLTIRLLLNAMGISIKASLAMWSLNKLSKGVLLFALGMVVVTLLMPMILIGVMILSAALLTLSIALYVLGSKQVKSGITMLLVSSLAILAFGIVMKSYANDISIKDVLIVGLSIVVISMAFWLAGKMNTSIMKGALALGLASLALIGITYGLKTFMEAKMTMEDGFLLVGILGGVALVFGLAGLAFAPIALGAIAIGLSALAIWAMSMALKEFQTLNWTKKNSDNLTYTIKSVLGALSGTSEKKGIMGNVTGAIGQGLQGILSLLSIGPLLVGSAAIFLMSFALEKFKSVQWDLGQNAVLGDTITMVLSALAGTARTVPTPSTSGGPLDVIMSFLSAGAIIVGSAAIFLMSLALQQFKKVQWDPSQNAVLGETISMVLSTLRGETPSKIGTVPSGINPFDAIVALMSAGSLIFASAGIWLMSEALIKFKTVKWTTSDSKTLAFTIDEILKVIQKTEENGGLWGSIKGLAKSAIGAGSAAANATSIGLSSFAILRLSEALIKWKSIGWDPGQTNNLTYALDKILLSFNSKPIDHLDKVADNFDRIQKSMKTLKDNINGMDLKKLTLTDSMMKSIAMLSKSPEAIGDKIAESIDKAFEDLAKAITDSIDGVKEEKGGILSGAMDAAKGLFSGGEKPTAAPKAMAPAPQSPSPSISKADLQQALSSALSGYFNANTITVKVNER